MQLLSGEGEGPRLGVAFVGEVVGRANGNVRRGGGVDGGLVAQGASHAGD